MPCSSRPSGRTSAHSSLPLRRLQWPSASRRSFSSSPASVELLPRLIIHVTLPHLPRTLDALRRRLQRLTLLLNFSFLRLRNHLHIPLVHSLADTLGIAGRLLLAFLALGGRLGGATPAHEDVIIHRIGLRTLAGKLALPQTISFHPFTR